MLILDIPKSSHNDDYIRVAVIGSCRARDLFTEAYKLDPKPPESKGAPECKTIWHRFSAFTHTASQALQYFRYVTSALDIAEELQPLVFQRVISPDIRAKLESLTPDILDSIDLFVAEVSTSTEVSVGNIHINISYTETNMVRAGGKPLLKWWRSVSASSQNHAEVIQETLNALPSKNIPDTDAMASIIKHTQHHTLSREELSSSITELKTAFGKPLMIVPVFNVPEAPSEARSELINTLYELSLELGYHFFDPTTVVAEAGCKTALKGGGVDINHYEQGFHYTLLKAVVPFLQQAVAEHNENGTFMSQRYEADPVSQNRIIQAT